MGQPSSKDEMTVRHQFDRLCQMALKGEAVNYYKHWNCLPWFICGLAILIRGNISRFNYGSMWIALLIMMWFFCPTEDINKLYEPESKVQLINVNRKWKKIFLKKG